MKKKGQEGSNVVMVKKVIDEHKSQKGKRSKHRGKDEKLGRKRDEWKPFKNEKGAPSTES